MSDAPDAETTGEHSFLVNLFIKAANDSALEYDVDFVASALVAAAAAYSAFNFQRAGEDVDVDRLTTQFRERLDEFSAQQLPIPRPVHER